MQQNACDTLLLGATIITANSHREVIPDGYIAVSGGRITALGPTRGNPLPQACGQTLDLAGHVILPGLVNVHTHTILTMVRGVAEDMGFAPAYTPGVPHGHEVTPDEAVALARLGALEALLFGSTLINDSYVHADLTLGAMAELGMRVYTCGRIHDVDFSRVHLGEWRHDPAIGRRTLDEALALREQYLGKFDGRVGVQLTPHAPDTCSRSLLEEIASLSTRLNARVTTHLSQSRMENERIQERDGCSPTELLEQVGLLNDRLTAAHGMYVSESDIQRMGNAKVNLAHVPKGNATGGRIAPTRAMRDAGVSLALGTDNMHADMIELMRWALCMARIQAGGIDMQWQPEDVLEMATINGARAMGLEDRIGSLEPGKCADLVCLDMQKPHLVPNIDPLGNIVHTGLGSDVKMVMVDGEIVVQDGRSTRVDEAAIMADAQAAAEALWARARASVQA